MVVIVGKRNVKMKRKNIRKRRKSNDMIKNAIKAELKHRGMSRNSLAEQMDRHISFESTMQFLSGRHDTRTARIGWILEFLELIIVPKRDLNTSERAKNDQKDNQKDHEK